MNSKTTRFTSLSVLRYLIYCLSLMVVLTSAKAADLEKGKLQYRPCATCHGFAAEGNINLRAPALSALPSWYNAQQYRSFRSGFRGTRLDDKYGAQMRPMAALLQTDAQLDNVLAYIESMPARKPPRTLEGDPVQGKVAYRSICATCHGVDANGQKALSAPRLRFLQDWYLLRAINSFRNGIRGNHKDDTNGKMMKVTMQQLQSDTQILDIIAYITEMD